jgi:hypothetical protein
MHPMMSLRRPSVLQQLVCAHAFLHNLPISFPIGSESQTTETATLVTSFLSDGSLEWISLHTKTEWTHCTFPYINCSICTTCVGMFSASIYKNYTNFVAQFVLGEFNRLYVEGAFPVPNQGADRWAQLAECNTSCVKNKTTCGFWTFSFLQDTGLHSRNHDNRSECGLR